MVFASTFFGDHLSLGLVCVLRAFGGVLGRVFAAEVLPPTGGVTTYYRANSLDVPLIKPRECLGR